MAVIHKKPSKLAGITVILKSDINYMHIRGKVFTVKDWADRWFGRSWMHKDVKYDSAVLKYKMRAIPLNGDQPIPIDDEVLYGVIDGRDELVHISEIKN
jgi:hypothetical protein